MSGVPCTAGVKGRDLDTVSIHLREWGALHLDTYTPAQLIEPVSIHLREWGALH
nr:hypothetical protein [Propionibacterium sp.]